jgi:hypothetical protein
MLEFREFLELLVVVYQWLIATDNSLLLQFSFLFFCKSRTYQLIIT